MNDRLLKRLILKEIHSVLKEQPEDPLKDFMDGARELGNKLPEGSKYKEISQKYDDLMMAIDYYLEPDRDEREREAEDPSWHLMEPRRGRRRV